MAEIGFLGLGTMGLAMARRLMSGGHTVVVWNRSPAAIRTLVSEGAIEAKSPDEALATGKSFSMLANDAAANFVPRIHNFHPGQLVVARNEINWRGDSLNNGVQNLQNSEILPGASDDNVVRIEPKELTDTYGNLDLPRIRHVSFCYHRDAGRISFLRLLVHRKRLGLDALNTIKEEESAFDARERSRHLAGKIDVPRSINKIQ